MGILLAIGGRCNNVWLTRVLGGTEHNDQTDSNKAPTATTSATEPIHSKETINPPVASIPQSEFIGAEEDEKRELESPDRVTGDIGLGQQKAEAAALVWSKPAVFGIYAWIWVCFFMLAFHSSINSNLINFVYSDFKLAPQVSTAYILSSVINGVLKLPLAKTLHLWGRAEALLVSMVVYIVGMIILAACNGPSAFAAGYVLYWIGYSCIYLVLDIFVADTSGLRSRAFAFAFASTPFICTAFTGPLAATSIRTLCGWRWGYGIFCIVQPVVICPLALVFKFYEWKAIKMGVWERTYSGRTRMQSVIHYIHEFDVIGAFILMAAWVLILLPFGLAQYGRSQYHSAGFIAQLVIGGLLLVVFAAWEKWGTRVHFIKYDLIKQPTILGACICSVVLYFGFYLWDQYFYNFCLITYNLNSTMAGYMLQIYNVGSTFWSPILGIVIYRTRRFKYICLFFGVPLMLLGSGLMIHFRGEEHGIGYVIMSQIFIAFAGGTLVIGNDMAVMACGGREGTPLMLALIGLFTSIGGSIGYAVSASIYNNVFVGALASRLPDELKSNATQIYSAGIAVQETYPPGSPLRHACAYAWGYAQRMNCIASTCILALTIPAVAIWRNYDVGKKQNKGTMIST